MILQITNYILPFITIPYLVRTIGTEYFGLLAFVSAVTAYLNVVVEYGFNLSATKEISRYRNDKSKLNEIFSSVMQIKFLLMFFCLLLLTIMILIFDKFSQNAYLYYYTFGIIIGNLLFPVWLFQGLEKMKYITYINITIKSFFTVLIFILVESQKDYYIVPILISLGSISSGVVSLYIAKNKLNIKFRYQKINTLKKYLYDGWHIFFSGFLTMPYTLGLPFFIGLFANNTIVGEFSIAQKILNAINSLYQPLSQALFPYIINIANKSKDNAKQTIMKIMKYSVLSIFLLSIITFIYAKEIIVLISGEELRDATQYLKIMSILPILITVSKIMSFNYIVTFNYQMYLIDIYLKGAAVSLLLIFILVPLYSGLGASFSVVVTELYLTFSMYKFIKQNIGFY